MEVIWVFIVILLLLSLFLINRVVNKDKRFFESQGVSYLGNGMYRLIYNAWTGTSNVDSIHRQYNWIKGKNQRFAGTKEFGQLVIMLADADLLKNIAIKDFDHFYNRREFDMPEGDELFSKMLFSLRGQTWKDFRSKIRPSLTTGRIKRLYKLFDQSGKKLVLHLQNKIHQPGSTSYASEINLQNAVGKFTLDIIASAVCGFESKTFDPEFENGASGFEKMARRMELKFSGMQLMRLFVILIFPFIGNLLKISIFDKEAQDYFLWAIKKTIKFRQDSPEHKWNDFIQLMLETREGKLKAEDGESGLLNESVGTENIGPETADVKTLGLETEDVKTSSSAYLDDEHITANCVLFILAGFDTTQSLLTFCGYALALNQDIQDRLRAEILSVVESEKDNGQEEFISYDALHSMTYLDMVMNETLRMYPPTVVIDRGCTQDYMIPDTDFVLKKGNGVLIPVFGFHRDARYFPEPEKFDPERFSVENKHKLHPHAYLPFGMGPRNCIGYRFGTTEAKLAVALLVHNFILEPSEKTLIPMRFQNYNVLKSEGDMHLSLRKIT